MKDFGPAPSGQKFSPLGLRTSAVVATAGRAAALSACTDPYDPGQRAIGGLFGVGTGAAVDYGYNGSSYNGLGHYGRSYYGSGDNGYGN
jgi:hypothetical protein